MMKKLFLLSIAGMFSVGAFAQSAPVRKAHAVPVAHQGSTTAHLSHSRTTAGGSVDTLGHISGTDTLANYIVGANADSGYCSGSVVFEDMGYAERYDFSTVDSSLEVLGVIALFSGTVNPASTHNAVFKVWTVGAQVSAGLTGRPNVFESGFPNTVLTSESVPFTQLGVGTTDTPKIHMFTTPTAYLHASFFVGCTINYTWATLAGDTIGLYSNKDGERTTPVYTVSAPDTIINNKNASQYSDATWHDNATDNFQIYYNYFLFPIVRVGASPLAVNGVKRNDLTFFGNYPNPATTSTNIRFSLSNSSDVTIRIMDMNGRTINTVKQDNLSTGEHILPIATADMPAGNYVYVITTASGSGIASTMSIVK